MERYSSLFKRLEYDLAHAKPRKQQPLFSLFCYDPQDEYLCRKRIAETIQTLEHEYDKRITCISLGEVLCSCIQTYSNLETLITEEKRYGFNHSQHAIVSVLYRYEDLPLATTIQKQMSSATSDKDIVFLVRLSACAPNMFITSLFLEQMQHVATAPVVVFFPGVVESKKYLRFMNLPYKLDLLPSSRNVKLYMRTEELRLRGASE